MNKRGMEKLNIYIMRLVIWVIIAIFLTIVALKASNDDIYKQRSTVIETSFIRDNVLASPSELTVIYRPLNKMSFSFEDNPCIISASTTEDALTGSYYPCIYNQNFMAQNINLKMKDSLTFYLNKNEKSIN